jgi:hypothetical protein
LCLQALDGHQPFVPATLQLRGYQPIAWIDRIILSARQPRFVTGCFQRQFGLPALVMMTILSAVDRG